MQDFLQLEYLNNTMRDYIVFAAVLIISLILILIVKKIIIGHLKHKAKETETELDDALVRMLSKYVLPLMLLAAVFFSTRLLTLSDKLDNVISLITLALFIMMLAIGVSRFFIFLFNKYWEKKNGVKNDPSVRWIGVIIKLFVWTVAVLLFLDNLDIEITALMAGLGLGGIAVAFAANAILQDLFSFVTIFFDRPFEIGDFVNVGEMSGTIEHIGVKTTRVRSLSGEQLVFSNTDLTNSRIRNYKRMETRRIAFTIGVTYDTPSEKLRIIPGLIKEIIDSVESTNFDRAHLKEFGDFSINFEVVYFVLSQDYVVYMDVNQDINLKIKDAFDKNGIEFAFPTQTVYVEKE